MPLRGDGTWFESPHPILQPLPDIDLGSGVLVTKGQHKGTRGIVLRHGSGIPDWLYVVRLPGGAEWSFSEEELEVVAMPMDEQLRADHASGKTIRQIAQERGRSKSAVGRALARAA